MEAGKAAVRDAASKAGEHEHAALGRVAEQHKRALLAVESKVTEAQAIAEATRCKEAGEAERRQAAGQEQRAAECAAGRRWG